MTSVAIIGAGLAGASAAYHLVDHVDKVTLFEKSRGVSGRMATRHSDAYSFDHGAQYFIVRTESFKHFLAPFIQSGVVVPWQARFVEVSPVGITAKRDWQAGCPHYVATPHMNALVKAILAPFEVRLNTQVKSLCRVGEQWQLKDQSDAVLGHFDWVVLAVPAPQAQLLLPPSSHLASSVFNTMQGCFTLMIGLESHSLLPQWGAAVVKNSILSWIGVQSSKPHRQTSPTLVVHSTNQWAEANLQVPLDQIQTEMLDALSAIIPIKPSDIAHCQLHRWRYANAASAKQSPASFIDMQQQLALCGDWCIKGRVESAFLSGHSAARTVATAISRQDG